MYKIFKNLLLAVMLLCCTTVVAQPGTTSQMVSVKGTVYSADQMTPLANVLVSSTDAMRGAVTGEDGTFEIEVRDAYTQLVFTAPGCFTQAVDMMGRPDVKVFLQNKSNVLTPDKYNTIGGEHYISEKTTSATAISKKDLNQAYTTLDNALSGRIAGLNIINKSGSVGEGSYYSVRGTRSLYADNAPLIVVDGVPMIVDTELSDAITGFSRNVFDALNLKEIESMTLLKGTDALAYGSMGSNGVLYITTEQGLDQETSFEVSSINGVSFIDKYLSVMDAFSYRAYAADVGVQLYPDTDDFATNLPFLFQQATGSGVDSYKYNYDTNWQDMIYAPAFTTDNFLKIKGGDEAVKFMFTVGYQNSEGVLDGTSQNKLTTRGNANIRFTPKLTAYASVALSYNDLKLQEQGMTSETNPVLAAYQQMPLLDVYQRNVNGSLTSNYSQVESIVGASNPVAILSGVEAAYRSYDMLINMGVDFQANRYLSFDVRFGINYNYAKDDIFIGGKSTGAIAALQGGWAENTVRSGASENKGFYVSSSAKFDRTYSNVHNITAVGSYQMITNEALSTTGVGINTTSDFYTTLSNVTEGKEAYGYVDVWNMMSAYVSGAYTYNKQIYVGGSVLADAASTYGMYSDRIYVYPGANVGWRAKNSDWLIDNDDISNLTLRGDFSIIPNSRFNSSLGRYYYELDMLYNISGLVRSGIPNEEIEPEAVRSFNLGADMGLSRNKVSFSVDFYEENTRNMIVASDLSPLYGFDTFYTNDGAMRTRGIELGFNSTIINKPNLQWIVAGTISTYATKILSLGNVTSQILEVDDDVYVINQVGSSPYEFYGLVYEGVYSTTAEAEAAGLQTVGGYSFEGGDAKFADLDRDGLIGDDDMTSIGSAIPDFFGGIQTRLKYKSFSLFANFTYSYGNDAYNGVRRELESADSFTNQASSVERRWTTEGDVTDIPKATYGDPAENNSFSSRWIEDASYVKLKELTFSYEHNRKLWFFTSAKFFLTAENLFTITKYTGLDPEFSYSYDNEMLGLDLAKVTLPKSVKLGLVLNF